jgi:phage recombination protein Bet
MSSTAITTTTPGQMAESYSQDQVKLIRDTFAKGASESEFQLFLAVAQKKGLDILSRQIHLVKRWDAKAQREVCEIQTGIDGYRLIADRTGRYEGQSGPFWCGADGQWVDVWLATEPPRAAKVGVWRAGCREPFWGVALFSEYCQTYKDKASGQVRPNPMWARMPAAQLAKCAEALALRKAFPAEMSGIYTTEEMGQASNVIDVTPTPTPAPAPKNAPRAISAAPAPIVAAVDTGLVEQLSQILDGLAGFGVADALILQGIANMTGQQLPDLFDHSLALLSPQELEKLITRYGTRLEQLEVERAGQPDRHAFDEPTTPADDIAGPQF